MGFSTVIVNSFNNNEKFLNNLCCEAGSQLENELNDNSIVFKNMDSKMIDSLLSTLAQCILSEFKNKILIKIINKNCDYLSKKDRYEVWKKASQIILEDEECNNREHKFRLESIKNKLENYFSFSNVVSVEGFVNFRLQEIEEDFEDVVEECVQDYLYELEYLEFINMLKYFVSVQNPLYLAVNVEYGEKVIFYADGKNITDVCVADFNRDACGCKMERDDFLINSLITISPKRIFIKQSGKLLSEEVKKTLLGIFGDKLTITTE